MFGQCMKHWHHRICVPRRKKRDICLIMKGLFIVEQRRKPFDCIFKSGVSFVIAAFTDAMTKEGRVCGSGYMEKAFVLQRNWPGL